MIDLKTARFKKLWILIITFIGTIIFFLPLENFFAQHTVKAPQTVVELKDFINSSEFEFENIPELEISAKKVHREFYPYFKFNNVSPVDYSKKRNLSFDPRFQTYLEPFKKLSQTHRARITFNICYKRCINVGFNPSSQDRRFFIELLKKIHDIEFKEVRIRELDGYLNYFDLTEYRIEGWYFERSIPKNWYDLKYNLIIYLIEKYILLKDVSKLREDFELLCRVTDRFGEYSFIHEEFSKRIKRT